MATDQNRRYDKNNNVGGGDLRKELKSSEDQDAILEDAKFVGIIFWGTIFQDVASAGTIFNTMCFGTIFRGTVLQGAVTTDTISEGTIFGHRTS